MEHITIFDTTLRDGEQSPGCSMNLEEKLRIARQLDRLRVDVIRGRVPIASEGDFDAVSAIAAEVRRPIIAALARAKEEDILRAGRAIRCANAPAASFPLTSDIHLKHKLRVSREEALRQSVKGFVWLRPLSTTLNSHRKMLLAPIPVSAEVLEAVGGSGRNPRSISLTRWVMRYLPSSAA